MKIVLKAEKTQTIAFELQRNDIVHFEDDCFGIVNSVVVKNTPKAVMVIHTIRLNDGKWRAAVKVTRKQ